MLCCGALPLNGYKTKACSTFGGVEKLFGRIPFEHAFSLLGASLMLPLMLTLTSTFAVKSPGISGDNVCNGLVWNERVDDFGHQVDNSVARVDVKCLDPLSVDRNKTLGEQQGLNDFDVPLFLTS